MRFPLSHCVSFRRMGCPSRNAIHQRLCSDHILQGILRQVREIAVPRLAPNIARLAGQGLRPAGAGPWPFSHKGTSRCPSGSGPHGYLEPDLPLRCPSASDGATA